jgi:hypothetical protein
MKQVFFLIVLLYTPGHHDYDLVEIICSGLFQQEVVRTLQPANTRERKGDGVGMEGEEREGGMKPGTESGKRAAWRAEEREGGKRKRVNETTDRMERGKQERQKKGKGGSKRGRNRGRVERGQQKMLKKGKVGSERGLIKTGAEWKWGQQERKKRGKRGGERIWGKEAGRIRKVEGGKERD